MSLTHWGRAVHIYASKLTIIASDNDLSPGRRQAIIWNNAGILSIGCLGTNFSEILIEILTFSFKKMHFKVSSAKRQPFCLGLNELTSNVILQQSCPQPRIAFYFIYSTPQNHVLPWNKFNHTPCKGHSWSVELFMCSRWLWVHFILELIAPAPCPDQTQHLYKSIKTKRTRVTA